MILFRRLSILVLLAGGACVPEDLIDTANHEAVGSDTAEISGGTEVPVGELEAVVRIGLFSICSGTLISDSVVLTAAHCVCDSLGNNCATTSSARFVNVLRHDDPTTPENEERTRGTLSILGDVVVHPDMGMRGEQFRNDLAVIRLHQPASQVVIVSPIPIATAMPAIGSAVTIAGFGGSNAPGGECLAPGGTKRRATTPLDDVEVGPVGDTLLVLDDGAIHGCTGDSGGPGIDPFGRLVGVISQGESASTTVLRAVPAHLEWIGLQGGSPGGRVGVWDVSGDAATPVYTDNRPDPDGLLGWIDGEDVRLTGDFFDLGYDQALYINRSGEGGRLRIADYADGGAPTESLYWESYTDDSIFDDWIDRDDVHLVGDFLHLGHDQLLLMNRETSGPVMIVSFETGEPVIHYLEDPSLAGWHQQEDGFAVGDFFGDGYDTVLFVNRGVGPGRIIIADFSAGQAPVTLRYEEHYGDGVQLDGWHDADDLLLAGDFRGLGRDQVLFVNRGAGNDRVLVADFADGAFPAEWHLHLTHAQASVLNGWLDTEDVALAGRFRLAGRDQLALINRTVTGLGRLMVADLSGATIAIPLLQDQVTESPILARIHQTDRILSGDLRGTGLTQLLTLENLED